MDLVKFSPGSNDIVVVDGLWGSGKSLLGPIVSSFSGMSAFRIDPSYEFLCVARATGKISHDAFDFLIKTNSDLGYYHNLIGREVNFRPTDDSGVWKQKQGWRYLSRLASKGGDSVVEVAQTRNMGYLLMTHIITAVSQPLFDVLSPRLNLITIERNPLFMVNHWADYLSNFNRMREGTVSYSSRGLKIPWFAIEWSDEFVECSNLERALLAITRCTVEQNLALSNLAFKEKAMQIRFDDLLFAPDKSIQDISRFLDRNPSRNTQRQLRGLGLASATLRVRLNRSKHVRAEASLDFRRDLETRLRGEVRPKIWEEFSKSIEDYDSGTCVEYRTP